MGAPPCAGSALASARAFVVINPALVVSVRVELNAHGEARAIELAQDPRVEVLEGAPHPPGWTGKLFAVSQGVAKAGAAPERK